MPVHRVPPVALNKPSSGQGSQKPRAGNPNKRRKPAPDTKEDTVPPPSKLSADDWYRMADPPLRTRGPSRTSKTKVAKPTPEPAPHHATLQYGPLPSTGDAHRFVYYVPSPAKETGDVNRATVSSPPRNETVNSDFDSDDGIHGLLPPPSIQDALAAEDDLRQLLSSSHEGNNEESYELEHDLRKRCEGMFTFLNLYTTEKKTRYPFDMSWRPASRLAATAVGKGPAHAKQIRQWTRAYILDRDALPVGDPACRSGCTNSCSIIPRREENREGSMAGRCPQ